MEDLTTGAVADRETEQLADLAALGLDHDGEVVRQSERRAHYDAAIDRLVDAGRTYDCFCSRREIREAAAAPHAPSPASEASEDGTYPGTCRDLSDADRARRRAEGRAVVVSADDFTIRGGSSETYHHEKNVQAELMAAEYFDALGAEVQEALREAGRLPAADTHVPKSGSVSSSDPDNCNMEGDA
jgi:hypothetical protein